MPYTAFHTYSLRCSWTVSNPTRHFLWLIPTRVVFPPSSPAHHGAQHSTWRWDVNVKLRMEGVICHIEGKKRTFCFAYSMMNAHYCSLWLRNLWKYKIFGRLRNSRLILGFNTWNLRTSIGPWMLVHTHHLICPASISPPFQTANSCTHIAAGNAKGRPREDRKRERQRRVVIPADWGYLLYPF